MVMAKGRETLRRPLGLKNDGIEQAS